jgi:hypothetical protein
MIDKTDYLAEANSELKAKLTMENDRERVKDRKKLYFSKTWPIMVGVFSGLFLRVAFFGNPSFDHQLFDQSTGQLLNVMGWGYIYLAPFVVGAITVYMAERVERKSYFYYFWAPFTANTLVIFGAILVAIEGLICSIIVFPLFFFLGGLGGIIMGAICRFTNWPKASVSAFATLPILVSIFSVTEPSANFGSIERKLLIPAKQESVWQAIHQTTAIEAKEVERGWIYRIGVPLPESGITQTINGEQVRRVQMGKSVYFDQVASEWEPNRLVRWRYRFYPDSFPPHALDDHVMIGGKYFDLLDTVYALRPDESGGTELTVSFRYRVSTDFNWYADWVAQRLIGNFEEVILDFYAARAVRLAAEIKTVSPL